MTCAFYSIVCDTVFLIERKINYFIFILFICGFIHVLSRVRICKLKSLKIPSQTKTGENEVTITGAIFGLAPGLHGFHIHMAGNLTTQCKE
jgi:hypothetical protein